MVDKDLELYVVECLYDDVGWAIHSASQTEEELKDNLKDARSEFVKDRIRTRLYRPEKPKDK